jgi:transcriptional regulator with XRE-family HTH domain
MTAKQLGKKTGLTGAQMSRVELGQCNISLGRMMDFAMALGFNTFTVSQAGANGPTLELGTKKHGCRTCFVETADVWPPYYRGQDE